MKKRKGLPMIDCDKLRTNFSDYLDEELPIEQRKELEDHFSVCLECQETIRKMKIIQRSLKQLPQISVSPDFEQKLHQQIFRANQKATFLPLPFHNWKIPAMGSAIVLATVSLFLVFNDSTEDKSVPVVPPTKIYSPAAPQLPGNQSMNISTTEEESSNSYQSSTLVRDSLGADSSLIDKSGVMTVGNK